MRACHCSWTPEEPCSQARTTARCCLPLSQRRRPPRCGLFGARSQRPTRSLSTLRSAGYPEPRKTRFRLVARPFAGRDSTAATRRPAGFDQEGFSRDVLLALHRASPFPGLSLAQAGWPWVVTHPGLPQIRTCAINASGSSRYGFATRGSPPGAVLVAGAGTASRVRESGPNAWRLCESGDRATCTKPS